VAAAALSLALHVSGVVGLGLAATAPNIDLEFQLPAEVEFGLTEGMEAQALASAAANAPPSGVNDESAGSDGLGDAGPPDAGPPDAGPADAGAREVDAGRVPDASHRRDTGAGDAAPRDAGAGPTATDAAADAGTGDAGSTDGADGGEGDASTRIPPGAQLAIRLQMERIRHSPLAPEVRRLLTAIPDWHALLDGSGLDPLEDLDRLLLASPNLQRERMVLAGRHAHDQAFAEAAAQRLAVSQHQTTAFHAEGPVRVAPWRNQDATPRVIALAGEHHFIICRPSDLPRVLALMRVRAEDQREDGGAPTMEAAEALLAMGDEDLMSFEVEGARRFLRSGNAEVMPISGRLVAMEQARGIRLRGIARFDSPEQAHTAQAFWTDQLNRLAANPMVALVRLDEPLRSLAFTQEGAELHFETQLGLAQARLVLGYVEGMLVQYRRDQERRRRRTQPPASSGGTGASPSPSSMTPPGPSSAVRPSADAGR